MVRRLDETGITAQDVALHKPTLDDVFLTLTGRGAKPRRNRSPQETRAPGTAREERSLMTTATQSVRHTRISAQPCGQGHRRSSRATCSAISGCHNFLIFATVQPVMFLLLFNYVFGGAIGGAIPPSPRANTSTGCCPAAHPGCGFRGRPNGAGTHRRPLQGRHRSLPVPAHGPFRRSGGANPLRCHPERFRHRVDGGDGVPHGVPVPDQLSFLAGWRWRWSSPTHCRGLWRPSGWP